MKSRLFVPCIALLAMGLSPKQASAELKPMQNQINTSESSQAATAQHSQVRGQYQLNQAGGVLKSTKICYPRDAQRESIEGWVKLQIDIDNQGQVAEVAVLDSKPARTFEKAAISGVKDWEFKKKIVDGQAVSYQHNQLIDFELINYTMVDGKHVIGKQ